MRSQALQNGSCEVLGLTGLVVDQFCEALGFAVWWSLQTGQEQHVMLAAGV